MIRKYDEYGNPLDSDSELVNSYLKDKYFRGDLSDESLAAERATAEQRRTNAGIGQGLSTIAAGLTGTKPETEFYENLAKNADRGVKDIEQRRKSKMDEARFAQEAQKFGREETKFSREMRLEDPDSPESRVFQNALKKASPGLFSDEELLHVSAADKDRVTSLAQLKEQTAARIQQARIAADARKDALKQKGTPGQQALDRNFAKDYNEFVATGGAADVKKGLTQLREVSDALGTKGNDYTGPIRGMLPDKVRAFTNPEAIDAKNNVEEVVQRNLRLVLGAQFTEKEGQALIKRAYNDQLSPEQNKKRLGRLISQIEQAAEAKARAAEYFEQNGTLQGFKGTLVNSANDFLRDEAPGSGGEAPPAGGAAEVERKTKDGKTAIFDAKTKKFLRYKE